MVSPFPSLSSIRAFEAAARHGGFAEAARELGTSAASVSYHVRQLEKEIGVTLFVRHPHRVELTSAGAMIARETVDAFSALRATFVRAAESEERRLSLTTLPTIGTSWLTPKLGRFRAKHPDIALEIDLSVEAQDLGAGRFDAALRNGHGRWPGLRATKLLPAIFMPLCAPALKSAATSLADPKRLGDAPLLGRPDWWKLWFHALGLRDVTLTDRFATQLSHEHLDIAAAVAGQGIAIGSPILFRSELESGRLVPAHDLVAGDGRAFWFTYPVARQKSSKILRFRDWISAEAAADCDVARDYIAYAIVVQPEQDKRASAYS